MLKRQGPSTDPHNIMPETMHYSDTDTLIKTLWVSLFNQLQIPLTLLSLDPHIFALTTNISLKDSDKSITGIKIGGYSIQFIYPLWSPFSPRVYPQAPDGARAADRNGWAGIQTSAQ